MLMYCRAHTAFSPIFALFHLRSLNFEIGSLQSAGAILLTDPFAFVDFKIDQ